MLNSILLFLDAGHTIVHDNVTYDFHILPSGLVSPSCINLIGAGTVVHVPSFFKELAQIETKGLTSASKRIFISDRAHVCFDLHSVVDGLEEAGLGGRKVGTTGKGIGPCYSDKAARRGVRVGEILDEVTFERKLRTLDTSYRARFGDISYDVEDEIARFKVRSWGELESETLWGEGKYPGLGLIGFGLGCMRIRIGSLTKYV
jgi:adenylosuccinate synthase